MPVILRSTKPPTSSQTSLASSSMRRRVARRHEFDVGPHVHCRPAIVPAGGPRAPSQASGCSPNYVIYQLDWVDRGYSPRPVNHASCPIPNQTSNSPRRPAGRRFPQRFPQSWLLPRRSTRTLVGAATLDELPTQLGVPIDVLVEQVPEPPGPAGITGLRAERAQPHEVPFLHLDPVVVQQVDRLAL